MSSMQDFMISRVRVKMLELFFCEEDEMFYVREITRRIKEEINAVRRELDRMLESSILKSEQRGNRLYYYLNKKYLYYQELQRMVAKSIGLGKKIRKLRHKLGQLDYVMFSGKFITGRRPNRDEVDVLVIGDVVLTELEELMKKEQERLGREVNYAVFSLDEFDFRKVRRDPFIMDILYSNRIMIIGDEISFAERKTTNVV